MSHEGVTVNGSEGRRLRVAIIGSGNIGTDLMYKVMRRPALELVGMAGIDRDSEGLARAAALGVTTTHRGLSDLLHKVDAIDLAFDATSASAHAENVSLLAAHDVRSVDLTPAANGPAVVPQVNLAEFVSFTDVNLITCGAQATVPIVAAAAALGEVRYAETVSTIASRSAGPGTRSNIDEFTLATARSLESVGGATVGKAIIILNPAEPPVMMRNTIYLEMPTIDRIAVGHGIATAVADVMQYVPGYRLTAEPLFDDGMVTVFIEVRGAGDFLPAYAGNLDVMTSAAVRVAEVHLTNVLSSESREGGR